MTQEAAGAGGTVPSGSGRPSGCASLAGRLAATLFGLPFVGIGLWFAFLIGRETVGSLSVYTWRESECTIDASEVKTNVEEEGGEPSHRFAVRYRWIAFGRVHEGDRLSPGYDGSDDVAEGERLAARFPVGGSATCWVDPDDPSRAYLERPGLFLPGCFILFPLLFVGAGAAWITAAWLPGTRAAARFRVARRGAAGDAEQAPALGGPLSSISGRAVGRAAGTGCLAGFFLVFAGAGLAFLVPFFFLPALEVVAARGWTPVPCRIETSGVKSHPGDDGATYSITVLYTYEVAGRETQGSRYGFLGGSSSGYEGKAAIVERLPPGTETTCWVNPQDPYDAVLERGFTPGFLFALIPLLFVLVGVGGAAGTLVGASRRRARAALGPGSPTGAAPRAGGVAVPADPDAPRILAPAASPWAKVLGILFLAAFWNGITGVFLWQVVLGWRQGNADGCATLFLLPFVLVGLALLVAIPYQILAAFNPRPVLTLAPGALVLGGSAYLDWRFEGAARRIRRLTLSIEGREEATSRRGKSSRTERSTFARLALADTEAPQEIACGSVTVRLPADLMHSFESEHHKVVWTLKVRGEIRRWPDVAEEIPLTVLPGERER